MKIHIVQKGDTLFHLATNYQVELKDLINSNHQLSNPDMLMPGMKITIPTSEKQINLVEKKTEKAKPELIKNSIDETETTIPEPIKRPIGKEEAAIPEPVRRPIGNMDADDDKAKKLNEKNRPLYPVVPFGEEEEIVNHKAQPKEADIAYTREDGGTRELPVEQRPMMSPPQHQVEFTFCCQCKQPIYQHKQG